MLWSFGKTQSISARTLEAIYGAVVTQARHPAFYRDFGVSDRVEGRFDMLVLHLWLVLRHLKAQREVVVSQALVDHFCSDMDHNLRELGVGDLKVPKGVMRFGEAFYGRARAYDAALESDGAVALAQALARNIYGDETKDAAPLAAYVRKADAALSAAQGLLQGDIPFPAPELIAS